MSADVTHQGKPAASGWQNGVAASICSPTCRPSVLLPRTARLVDPGSNDARYTEAI